MGDNNYLKILRYLAQFQGDGKMYEVEPFLRENGILGTSRVILSHLEQEGFIETKGMRRGVQFADYPNRPTPIKGIITLKGLTYLKSEENKNATLVQNISSHNAFVTTNSPNSTFNVRFGNGPESYREISEQIKVIRETLENDKVITAEFKEAAIESFALVLDEIDKEGKVLPQTRMKVLDWGSKISSIGSFTINLIRLFDNKA